MKVDEAARRNTTVQFCAAQKIFHGRGGSTHTAVDTLDLTITPEHRIGIVGESGSGKSTLVRMMVGLEHPTHGTVEYNGRSIAALGRPDMRAFRRDVQLVAQDTSSSFDPRRTLRDAIRRPVLELLGKSARAADVLVDETVAALELDPALADRYPHQVSGGQRQRFSIARALVVGPALIICDEAVSALDVSVQGAVLNLLKAHCENNGAGLVFVSHGLPATAFIAEELIVMYRGVVVERGATADVLHRSKHPYTRALVDAYRTTAQRTERRAEVVA
ncbi:ABC transporter ATP-binding protein [Nocardia higoensis]|uniref:ABC transporter ATP-binding protein n=1 Tax=Nocardia higoensis TaxID=228599 RepID=UPI0009FDB6A8|nr:ATP-binding cassette domain-containing protein [Nocardia higoensis]